MKQTTIDTSLLPHVWLNWRTTKGVFYLNCDTGEKLDHYPSHITFNRRWDANRTNILINANSRPVWMYAKYHEDIEMLELAAITIYTTRKEVVHEWEYLTKYFIDKKKNVYDENGNMRVMNFSTPRNYGAFDFDDYIRVLLRAECSRGEIVSEFQKFLGEAYYTIGNGRTVEVEYPWHIEDWYVKKQAVKGTKEGKETKLVNKLTAIPLSDCSDFLDKYPKIRSAGSWGRDINGIIFCERVDKEWSVLRMFYRVNNFNTGEQLVETERMYLNDNGKNRIAASTKEGWIPSRKFAEWSHYYQFVNAKEAVDICPRLKYLMPLFDSDDIHIKKILMNALRFPEIEQLIKMGHKDFAMEIARSDTPKADMKSTFGGYYKENEKTFLRKIGMTKYQFNKHMEYNRPASTMRKMREWFEDDLIHLDNATFDKWYEAFHRLPIWGFYQRISSLGLDYTRFIKNTVRLGGHHNDAYTLIPDTISRYYGLESGTRPQVNWYFDSYSELVRTHDAIDALKREQEMRWRARYNAQQAEELKKQEEKRIKLDEERKKFEYEDDEYIIRLPKDGTEITDEGIKQGICIGGYVSSHSNGYTNLFFLRKKSEPNEPFYAIEMSRYNEIVQIHGRYNRWLGNNPEAIPTVIRWLRKHGITCKDAILTCKSIGYCSTNEYVPMPIVI